MNVTEITVSIYGFVKILSLLKNISEMIKNCYSFLSNQDEKDQILTSNVWLNLVSYEDIFHQ